MLKFLRHDLLSVLDARRLSGSCWYVLCHEEVSRRVRQGATQQARFAAEIVSETLSGFQQASKTGLHMVSIAQRKMGGRWECRSGLKGLRLKLKLKPKD